ncbi:MAG: hypothetical protein ACFCUE_11905 [Candidatus Bathyarchaeia archaeon]|jgi:hypothetical protein
MATDADFKDIYFCKRIIDRSIKENRRDLFSNLLFKISPAFLFSSKEFREDIISQLFSVFNSWSFSEIYISCKDSVLGNVFVITYLIEKIRVITVEQLELMAAVLDLKQIIDPITFEYVTTLGKLVIDINEKVRAVDKEIIGKAACACEFFFFGGKLQKSKETIQGILFLYENSSRSEHKFKARVVSSLLNKRLDLFIALINKFCKGVNDEASLKNNFSRIYDLLNSARLPIYFDSNNFRTGIDKFYNNNFFFALIVDTSGTKRLILPYDEADSKTVQKVFDIENGLFTTPLGRVGKIKLDDIFSFRKIRGVQSVSHNYIQICKSLSENEIGEKIRDIAQDLNITAHGPAELADIYFQKLHLNNDSDLRDCAIILKGKGYPKITLSDLASNILKAVDLPVQVILLIHTGILLDIPREKFTTQCERARKIYCVVDVTDLARLLVAYGKL